MKIRVTALAFVIALGACAPRQVEVRTAPTQATAASVEVHNTLTQAVNVYAVVSGSDTFLRQVEPNSTQTIPAQGFASGSNVTLKAVTVDGVHTYTKANVMLNGTVIFNVP